MPATKGIRTPGVPRLRPLVRTLTRSLFPRAFRWIGRMNAPSRSRARVIMAIALGRAGSVFVTRCPDQPKPTHEPSTVRRESWLPPFPVARRYERDRDATSRAEESRSFAIPQL